MLPFFPLMVRLHVICIQPAESGVRVHSRISQDCENQWRQTHHGHVCIATTKLHKCPKTGVMVLYSTSMPWLQKRGNAQWAKSGVFVQWVYYQIWNWVLKCVQGCCRVCPWVLQNVCRVTELSNIFSNFSKIFFGAKKYFKQKVATQAKSQRGLKIIHRLVQSLWWSLIQSYLVVPGGAGATKSSA